MFLSDFIHSLASKRPHIHINFFTLSKSGPFVRRGGGTRAPSAPPSLRPCTWRLMGTAARGGSPALMHFRCLSWRSFPAFIRFVRMFPSALHVPNGRVYRRHVDPHPHQVGVSIVMVDVDPHTPHVGRSVYCISQVRRLVSLVVSLFRHIPDVQIRLEDVTC